ncbi:HdeD family acid-resistance protein [Algibacter mikhailovii]|uniref:Membrane protein n=1 Tax=Algibacter mikhailovii TaxID=425498 RepID=A0A918V634_9FLAO|nr:DUF308 domain-containing protein [Algibacter mikhailovii]GGZ74835.1 membrane protein [Algibacter mikhailovii]
MSNIISQSIHTIKHWWLFLLSGILLILGSVYVFSAPQESYLSLAWVFSILVFANGISNVIFSIANRKELKGWGWYLTGGIFEILIGIILLSYPAISIILLPVFIGFWLLFRGINIIGNAFELKNIGVLDWGWFLLFGVTLAVVASSMILLPIIGHITVIILTAFGLFILGIANIILSFKLKKVKSLTIDKVDQFKNKIKSEFNNLKKEVINNYEQLSEEEKLKIDQAFEKYEANS